MRSIVGEARHALRALARFARRHPLFSGVFLVFAIPIFFRTFHSVTKYLVDRSMNFHVRFGTLEDERAFRKRLVAHRQRMREMKSDPKAVSLPRPAPFREIPAPFDEDALCWGSDLTAGLLVFDANGDARLDLYVTQAPSQWNPPTGKDGLMASRPRPQHNGLYINLGNHDDGRPRFVQAKEIARSNDRFVAEELLVENYLYPRRTAGDTEDRPARLALTAVAADIDADGRPDLIVGNGLPGFLLSDPQTQRVLPPFINPSGRKEHKVRGLLEHPGLHFLSSYVPRNDIDGLHQTARGLEPLGANSVYLNLGDRDGDGLPEWRDATVETGLGGKRNTIALVVSDIDRDGDLDVFEGNSGDPDIWPGGSRHLAGEANQLYLNQLAETGELRFLEKASEMDVDGVYDAQDPPPKYYHVWRVPILPLEYTLVLGWLRPFDPGFLVLNGVESEHAQVTWAAMAQDVDDDGYPEIWTANDFSSLQVHMNQKGKRFRLPDQYFGKGVTGNWMTFIPGDFDGDGREDLFAGNMGGATMNIALSQPRTQDLIEPTLAISSIVQQHWLGNHTTMHALLDGRDPTKRLPHKVRHSTVLPPDVSLPNNFRTYSKELLPRIPYDPDSLDSYEFAWGGAALDVQNDGRLDLYWIGGLLTRGGGLFPITATNPGRLLVNATKSSDALRFVDLTAEYHLFNIHELDYSPLERRGFIQRPAPAQNWGRRSTVRSFDLSVWGLESKKAIERVANHDLIQCAENGRGVVAADLNGDGFQDVVLRNYGGYDSRRSRARNLMARVAGRVAVIPSPDPNLPSLTEYEPGSTRLFLNTHDDGDGRHGWLSIELRDDTEGALNRDAIGARVTVDGSRLRTRRMGATHVSSVLAPLHVGLGEGTARRVEVRWPDRARTVSKYDLGGLRNARVTLFKSGRWTLR